ncbi:MAG: hypothetical protein GY750_20945 [Lentisphaerae bacterium]|nr:hypothetical protein [Lentisphaerota bacterium]
MADKAQAWISTMWPVVVAIIGIVYHSATFRADVMSQFESIKQAHRFELKAIEDNVKRNELRTARLESSIINSESKLTDISKNLDKLAIAISNLKYIYVSKDEAKNFLTKEMIDGRLIKSK